MSKACMSRKCNNRDTSQTPNVIHYIVLINFQNMDTWVPNGVFTREVPQGRKQVGARGCLASMLISQTLVVLLLFAPTQWTRICSTPSFRLGPRSTSGVRNWKWVWSRGFGHSHDAVNCKASFVCQIADPSTEYDPSFHTLILVTHSTHRDGQIWPPEATGGPCDYVSGPGLHAHT